MTTQSARSLALFALLALAPWCALADDAPKPVEPVKLADRIYTFTNTGSNSTAIVGDESVILVDAGSTPEQGTQLLTAIATLTPKPVRILVNTHWHFDHVNGNEPLSAAGAAVVSQREVRTRMIAEKSREVGPGFPTLAYRNAALALPAITFDRELTLHSDAEEILLFHPVANLVHTDGDTVVFYRHANIVQTGDLYFEGVYPFIDVAAGGWIDGLIAGCREILARIDDKTVVVPGHGPVTDKKHLEAYVAMLEGISAKVTALVKAGKTLEEVQAAKPTADYDAVWGQSWNKPDTFAALAYNGIVAHAKK
jgi:glyoxylase-like metal-dependent hydrolase (beta-lactamase superfamily II)